MCIALGHQGGADDTEIWDFIGIKDSDMDDELVALEVFTGEGDTMRKVKPFEKKKVLDLLALTRQVYPDPNAGCTGRGPEGSGGGKAPHTPPAWEEAPPRTTSRPTRPRAGRWTMPTGTPPP